MKGFPHPLSTVRARDRNARLQHHTHARAPLSSPRPLLALTSSAQPAVVRNDIVTYVRVTMGSCEQVQGEGGSHGRCNCRFGLKCCARHRRSLVRLRSCEPSVRLPTCTILLLTARSKEGDRRNGVQAKFLGASGRVQAHHSGVAEPPAASR